MKTVNTTLLENWIKQNGPDAVSKLNLRSRVSTRTIARVRAGKVPRSDLFRESLATAVGTTEENLFPVIGVAEELKAS